MSKKKKKITRTILLPRGVCFIYCRITGCKDEVPHEMKIYFFPTRRQCNTQRSNDTHTNASSSKSHVLTYCIASDLVLDILKRTQDSDTQVTVNLTASAVVSWVN